VRVSLTLEAPFINLEPEFHLLFFSYVILCTRLLLLSDSSFGKRVLTIVSTSEEAERQGGSKRRCRALMTYVNTQQKLAFLIRTMGAGESTGFQRPAPRPGFTNGYVI
jgi:hypothetical protein